MEEGVVNEILQGPLREVFDSTQLLTDVSGSGNNWWETDCDWSEQYAAHSTADHMTRGNWSTHLTYGFNIPFDWPIDFSLCKAVGSFHEVLSAWKYRHYLWQA